MIHRIRIAPLILMVAHLYQSKAPWQSSSRICRICRQAQLTRSKISATSRPRVHESREKSNPALHFQLSSQVEVLHSNHQHQHLLRPLAMLQGREGASRSKTLPSLLTEVSWFGLEISWRRRCQSSEHMGVAFLKILTRGTLAFTCSACRLPSPPFLSS